MNKVALVTLWVDPAEHQILKYDFENIDLDFLPGRSLVRLDGMNAAMEMGQPFPSVWLPRSLRIGFDLTLATRRSRWPLRGGLLRLQARDGRHEGPMTARHVPLASSAREALCFVAGDRRVLVCRSVAHAQETIAEIRVHGNHTTPDADVIGLSGLKTGDAGDRGAARRSRAGAAQERRFDDVEVRKRFRSIDNPVRHPGHDRRRRARRRQRRRSDAGLRRARPQRRAVAADPQLRGWLRIHLRRPCRVRRRRSATTAGCRSRCRGAASGAPASSWSDRSTTSARGLASALWVNRACESVLRGARTCASRCASKPSTRS